MNSEVYAKSKSETCHNFWQPLVKKIYACNTDGIFPDKDGVFAAFARLQKARPNVGFEISYMQEFRGYRERDKMQAICISKTFEGRGSISLIVNCEAEFLSIHFEYADIEAFNVPFRRSQCDLGATLDNLANFIEEFPSYCEQSSRIITEIEKEQKLEEIARDTIRATVSHIMESSKYSWNLTEDEKHLFARSLNQRRILRRNGFQHPKLPRPNSVIARHPETNGKLLKRNSVPDNDYFLL